MRVRLAMPVPGRGTRVTALSAAGTLLAAVTVSACTGGAPASAPTVLTPRPTAQAQSTPSGPGASGTARPSAGVTTARVPASPGRTSASGRGSTPGSPSAAAPAATSAPVPSATRYPSGAPETGGGGTAGLQDGVLFGAGGAGILAGLASLAYRRRLIRARGPRSH